MVTHIDQATTLRGCQLHPESPSPALIAVASGKGGVGKTFVSINLGLALHQRGRRCLVVDMDWGLANVDVALGLAPPRHLGHVLSGQSTLDDAVVEYEGMPVLANACGEELGASACAEAVHGLLTAVQASRRRTEVVIADTHPGIAFRTTRVLSAATLVLAVTTPEPTSITDTYAILKVLAEQNLHGRVGLIVNQAGSVQQAMETAAQLDAVAQRFLGHGVPLWGWILQDALVPRCVREQRALLTHSRRSAASRCIADTAQRVESLLCLSAPVRVR